MPFKYLPGWESIAVILLLMIWTTIFPLPHQPNHPSQQQQTQEQTP